LPLLIVVCNTRIYPSTGTRSLIVRANKLTANHLPQAVKCVCWHKDLSSVVSGGWDKVMKVNESCRRIILYAAR
jgi:hypothetical protein